MGVFSLYDRVRLHLLAEGYPALRKRDETLWSVGPGVGLQSAWPF